MILKVFSNLYDSVILTGQHARMSSFQIQSDLHSKKGQHRKGTFKGHLVQPPCNEQGHLQLDRLLRAPSNLTLNVSRDGASATSLGNLFQCFTTLISKSTIFQFKTITPCPIATGPIKKLVLIFLVSSLKVLKGCNKVSSELSLLQAEQTQLSQPFLLREVFHPSDHFCGPPLDLLQQVPVFTVLRAPELDSSSSCTLPFLTPSLHNRAASLYSSQDTCPCFHCLGLSFLPFCLTSRSQLIHASLLSSFPDFLHLRIENSCALWKVSLKMCQLCSATLSLRAVSQGILLTYSLKSWKTANPISARSLEPRLPPVLTSPISSLAL
ncbi:hypothetical protein QYF61_018782, partial [Mycteria americana]